MNDISSFMSSFIDSIISIFESVFLTLSSIQFLGVSLLSYIIAIVVLSAAIPIIVSIVSGGYSSSRSYYKRSRSRSERSQGDSNE